MAEANSIDWGLLVGLASLGFGVVSAVYAALPYNQTQINEDAEYRREIAKRLRGSSLGERYKVTLERMLVWLNRFFGNPGSVRALGVCILVAAWYACASFFLPWGIGGKGIVFGFPLLPDSTNQPWRAIYAVLAMLSPLIGYHVGRLLALRWNRVERRVQAWLLLSWRSRIRSGRRFDLSYRIMSGLIVMVILLLLSSTGGFKVYQVHITICHLAFPLVGAIMGRSLAHRIQNDFWAGCTAFSAGALVGWGMGQIDRIFQIFASISIFYAGTGVLLIFLDAVLKILVSFIAAVTGIGSVVVAIIVSVAIVFTQNITDEFIRGVAVAVGTISVLSFTNRWVRSRGYWAGGFGALAGLSIFGFSASNEGAADPFALFGLLFFFILPIANGLFDWLSWWATRALGLRLLGLLTPDQNGLRRGFAILTHGLADLAASVALLLLMAYTLALGFEVYNQFAKFQGREIVFALRPVIETATAAPSLIGFWINAMLFSTLLPTFGHGLMLLVSPIGSLFIPDSKRLELALALENYDSAGDKQASIRRRVANWISLGQFISLTTALLLLIWLLGRFATFVLLFTEGGLASFVSDAAYAGIDAAERLGKLLLGN